MLDNKIIENIKKVLADSVDGAVQNVHPSQSIEKAVKPEVSKETLVEVIKELQEIIVGMVEIEEEDSSETEPVAKMDGQTDIETENENETYKSDNQDEDKWDNEMQKCWSGYTQRGMKEKGGRMVPNCVPVEKAEDLSEADQVKKSFWGKVFIK